MRRLWRDIRSNRRCVTRFVLILAVLWAVTVVTWMYDPEGGSVGMPGWVFFMHLFLLPLVTGLLTSRWPSNSGLAGLLAAELDLGIVVVWGGVLMLLGRVTPDPDTASMAGWGGVFEVLEFAVLMGVPGFLLGLLGGFAGRAFGGRAATTAG